MKKYPIFPQYSESRYKGMNFRFQHIISNPRISFLCKTSQFQREFSGNKIFHWSPAFCCNKTRCTIKIYLLQNSEIFFKYIRYHLMQSKLDNNTINKRSVLCSKPCQFSQKLEDKNLAKQRAYDRCKTVHKHICKQDDVTSVQYFYACKQGNTYQDILPFNLRPHKYNFSYFPTCSLQQHFIVVFKFGFVYHTHYSTSKPKSQKFLECQFQKTKYVTANV
eukprot:TRINITY_DN35048_c0_g1_i2.p1 TRINITY_DN35048_c0_g1~~TRINITY_DN35048_c0_g1_i2.p1  ORF type:complete len:220 (+),score=-5.12 TRINITY_DN35048_c0_g1_i2:332-991(+)